VAAAATIKRLQRQRMVKAWGEGHAPRRAAHEGLQRERPEQRMNAPESPYPHVFAQSPYTNCVQPRKLHAVMVVPACLTLLRRGANERGGGRSGPACSSLWGSQVVALSVSRRIVRARLLREAWRRSVPGAAAADAGSKRTGRESTRH